MSDFLIGIGKRLKDIRKQNNMTINDLASKAHVSNGLVSRIENGRTIPSLPVLLNSSSRLILMPVISSKVWRKNPMLNSFMSPKKAEQVIEKEVEAEGFKYMHIFSKSLHSLGFEAVLLTIEPNSKREKVITDAWEFKYILKGKVKYLIENEEVEMHEGDSLYFNGKLPHVPVSISDENCIMLVLYFYSDKD